MRAEGQRRNPLLVKLAFLQDLHPRVEIMQFNGGFTQIEFCRLINRQRQIAQIEVFVTITQFDAAQRSFRQRQGFEILAVAEVNEGKTDGGPANGFAVARRIDNVGRQRGKNAAVAFDLMQRQRRRLFTLRRRGGICGRGIGGRIVGPDATRRSEQQRRKQEHETRAPVLNGFNDSDKQIYFHWLILFFSQQTSGGPVGLNKHGLMF